MTPICPFSWETQSSPTEKTELLLEEIKEIPVLKDTVPQPLKLLKQVRPESYLSTWGDWDRWRRWWRWGAAEEGSRAASAGGSPQGSSQRRASHRPEVSGFTPPCLPPWQCCPTASWLDPPALESGHGLKPLRCKPNELCRPFSCVREAFCPSNRTACPHNKNSFKDTYRYIDTYRYRW